MQTRINLWLDNHKILFFYQKLESFNVLISYILLEFFNKIRLEHGGFWPLYLEAFNSQSGSLCSLPPF